MSSFKLSATAAEFKPSSTDIQRNLVTLTQQQGSCLADLQLNHPAPPKEQQQWQQQQPGDDAGYEDHNYDYSNYEFSGQYNESDEWGWYDEGQWIPAPVPDDDAGQATAVQPLYNLLEHESHLHLRQQQHQQQQQPQQQQQQQQQQPQQTECPIEMGVEDAALLLASWYPKHPPALLRQLLENCQCDVQQAAVILCDLEHEQRQQQRAVAASADTSGTSAFNQRSSGAARKLGFSYSLEQFPALTHSQHTTNTGSSSSTSSSSWAAVTGKPTAQPAKSNALSTTSSSRHSRGASAATAADKQQRSARQHSTAAARRAPDAAAAAVAVPWVKTGAAVSQEYAAARAEARDHARVRNACFHQATLAYLAGDKALAKELSAKGRAAAESMWAAHERASAGIYQQRNARLQQQQQQQSAGRSGDRAAGVPVIDLHGLHVREVQQLLPEQLATLQEHHHQVVHVIVGAGHHTKGAPSARVGPAVEALLQELGYGYKQPQPGLLRVHLA